MSACLRKSHHRLSARLPAVPTSHILAPDDEHLANRVTTSAEDYGSTFEPASDYNEISPPIRAMSEAPSNQTDKSGVCRLALDGVSWQAEPNA